MTAGGAVLPVALIALIFGNQWMLDAIRGEGGDGGLWPLLYWLQTPQWHLYPDGFYNWGYVISMDVGLILLLVLIAGLTAAGVRAVDPKRGLFGAAVAGWWACVVAGGVTGFVTGVLVKLSMSDRLPLDDIVWGSISGGAVFGFAYGWLPALGALAGFHFTRDRGFGGAGQMQQQFGQQQPFGQQPYQPQPGAPMQPQLPPVPGQQPMPGQPMPGQPVPGQQPYAPPQQHPSAVPYVPPQGGPQQPAWGATPQQPAVPPQASAPEPPAPAQPPAPDAPTLEPPTQQDDPEPADDAGTGAGTGGGGDLADKTMLDHEPDAGREPDARDDRPMPPPA